LFEKEFSNAKRLQFIGAQAMSVDNAGGRVLTPKQHGLDVLAASVQHFES
jgi:hypothetical protein